MVIKDHEELIGRAHELLVLKMQSANVREALNAVDVSGQVFSEMFFAEIRVQFIRFQFNSIQFVVDFTSMHDVVRFHVPEEDRQVQIPK